MLTNSHTIIHIAGVERKISDGDYTEKTLEFPGVLKQLNKISPITLLREEFLSFYAPVKSISERCVKDSKIYLQGMKDFEPWAIQSKWIVTLRETKVSLSVFINLWFCTRALIIILDKQKLVLLSKIGNAFTFTQFLLCVCGVQFMSTPKLIFGIINTFCVYSSKTYKNSRRII